MPLCTLTLVSLPQGTSIPTFLSTLRSAGISPIVVAKPLRWIILPSSLSTTPLLSHSPSHPWTLLLLLPPGTTSLPSSILASLPLTWSIRAGIPSRLLKDFESKNESLLNPPVAPPVYRDEKPLTTPGSRDLELDSELEEWVSSLPERQRSHPISMLNLLAFVEGRKGEYLKYGAAFGESAGKKHGGNAKIVGTVVKPEKPAGEGWQHSDGSADGWDEIAIAHYPSLRHFCAMLGSREYQEANKTYRVGSLRDTCILCTMEVGDDGELRGGRGAGSKL
ncbi:hypothetical protein EJ06DRAFT_541323 [Trichodelitschia bisporula]|uniref:DUF1330 domain-containing protein n=1 Tax=Trichodelitschia bisporula TaxID=703511 RepID=A0A6G1I684_9PEZI|nr:hypothetical protein EJ06DRAFT_541323 [Trichodelitschia bisporula]